MKGMKPLLAEHQGTGCVRICECGCLNLNIGVVTLHLDPATFLRTTELLRRAAEQYLERSESVSVTTEAHQAHSSSSGRFPN